MRITLGRLAAMVGMPVTELVSKIHEIAGLSNNDMPDGIEQEELPRVPSEKPAWMIEYHPDAIKWVDVTPLDAHLGDPMPPINIAVNTSKPGEVIGIKHMWEPQPLFDIWHSRGFEFWTEKINPDLWHVYVYHPPTR